MKKKRVLNNFEILDLKKNLKNFEKRILEIFYFLEKNLIEKKNFDFLKKINENNITFYDLEIINTICPNFFLFENKKIKNEKIFFLKKNKKISHNLRKEIFIKNLNEKIKSFFLLKKKLDIDFKIFTNSNILKINTNFEKNKILVKKSVLGNLEEKKNLLN